MRWLKNSYLITILVFLYLPIAILIVFSVNDAKYAMTWHGFSLRWYQELFADHDLLRTAWHSVILGISASTCTVFLGTLITSTLYHYRFPTRTLLHNLLLILVIAPDLVIGIILLILFSTIKVPLGFFSLLIAHITLCLPFATLTIYSRAMTLNPHYFEAANDLGATDVKVFFKILIPLLAPAILAAWLLAFAISLDDVIISFFVSGPSFSILSLKIYSMTRLGITPKINALCSILLGITLILILSYQVLKRKYDV